jgi:hypothetical protein
VLQEPVEKLPDVEMGGTRACTVHFLVGERDRVALAADETVVGEGYPEDIGAREVQAEWPWGCACRWPYQGLVQTWEGDVLQETGVAHLFFAERPGDGGEGFAGTKQWAQEGRQGVRALERPPPGTMEWLRGWYWSWRPQVWRTAVHPGRTVPMQRASLASRLRAVADTCNRAWSARRCCGRRKGRSVAGTVQVRRKCGPGSCFSRW